MTYVFTVSSRLAHHFSLTPSSLRSPAPRGRAKGPGRGRGLKLDAPSTNGSEAYSGSGCSFPANPSKIVWITFSK